MPCVCTIVNITSQQITNVIYNSNKNAHKQQMSHNMDEPFPKKMKSNSCVPHANVHVCMMKDHNVKTTALLETKYGCTCTCCHAS